uniref:Bifunctional inhibitor/plant lipid transfer protein/seed storage helical domain-containing protein n=1 Tax=Setaria italica TaxID=4555 RepID=K3ZD18_SETIT
MAQFTAYSKRTTVFVVVPLLMALLTGAVSASRDSFQLQEGQPICSKVRTCTEAVCTAMTGAGSCEMVGQDPHCCCHPTSSTSIPVQQLVH